MYTPLHLETDAAGLPLVNNFVSQDLSDDPDPAIGDKIAEVHRNRFADHPEIREPRLLHRERRAGQRLGGQLATTGEETDVMLSSDSQGG
jgi:hypothetical protein